MTRLCWEAESPAKVNLGLEILGKRRDGYHEIRSVLSAISLVDHLTVCLRPVETADRIEVTSTLQETCELADYNLVERAVSAFRRYLPTLPPVAISLTKHIPLAAGLGGASSNAATTIRLLNAAMEHALGAHELHEAAVSLGSDVPFFLGATTAMVSGTGTELQPLPCPCGSLVLVTPSLTIPEKTTTLYRALSRDDWSNGSRCDDVVNRLKSRTPLDPAVLTNAFSRALHVLAPETTNTREAMLSAGCEWIALSGAGPTHYAILDTPEQAEVMMHRLIAHHGEAASTVHKAQFLDRLPEIRERLV